MNILKINQYFLKQVLNDNIVKLTIRPKDNGKLYLLNEDQSAIFIIPEDDFHIELYHKDWCDLTPLVKQIDYFEDHTYCFDKLNYIEDIVRDKKTLHHFQSEKGYHIYIDKKKLDLFKDRYSQVECYIDKEKSGLVYILENEKCVGAIMNVRI